jgi:hypothetical protein
MAMMSFRSFQAAGDASDFFAWMALNAKTSLRFEPYSTL